MVTFMATPTPAEIDDVIARAHHVSNDGGDGRPGDLPVENQDKEGVQHHVEQIAQQLAHHGPARLPLRPDHIGIAVCNKHTKGPETLTMVR